MLRLPGVTLVVSYSASRNKTATGVTFTAASSGPPFFTLHTTQLVVTYAPDVFGGVKRRVESLMATAEFQTYQLEAAYLTLTSNVVAAAVQEASLRGQIAATEEIIRIQTDSLDILHKQFALGQVAGADVAAVEATLAQAQATLPPLQKQLAVQRDLMTALIGRFPSQEPAEKFELASLQLPLELPVSLPSKLVEQRPDIQAAAAQLHAAGRRRLQSAEMYRSTVIAALQNVADALHAVQSEADTLKASYAAERAALQEPRDRARAVASRCDRLSRSPDSREHL